MSKHCIIEAPCKINLHLKIGEKRPDGFHSLESLIATLALGDTLFFEKGDCHLSVDYEIPMETILPENNLVSRAVSLYKRQTGYESALRIHLIKRIPAGAGLGGGSSDAASTLLALNLLSGMALPMENLMKMAEILGSDVPFFLSGGTAFVSERGESVESVNSPINLWVVLVKPPFSSGTASAYGLLDRSREEGIEVIKGKNLSREELIRFLEDDPAAWPFENDFLPVFLDYADENSVQKPGPGAIYRDILNDLRKTGASFAGLSGSGSCCFGIFTMKETAEKAEKTLSGQGNFTRMTFFLARRADPVLK